MYQSSPPRPEGALVISSRPAFVLTRGCKRAKSEELRLRALQDLLDRVGLPRMAPADGAGGVKAIATVVNIVRPDASQLGV